VLVLREGRPGSNPGGRTKLRLALVDDLGGGSPSIVVELTSGHVQVFYANFTAGRAVDAELFLDDVYASPRHAVFYPDDDGWWIEDLGSTNGTYVDGERVRTRQQLGRGATVRIGHMVMKVVPVTGTTTWTMEVCPCSSVAEQRPCKSCAPVQPGSGAP
jgi:FHA domain